MRKVTSRADGYGNRECSCGGVWKDGDEFFSTLKTTTKPNEIESCGEMLQRLGMDGYKWAEEMHKRFPAIAQDDLLGWCCNMIMAGYDEAVRRASAKSCHSGDDEEEVKSGIRALLKARYKEEDDFATDFIFDNLIRPHLTTQGDTNSPLCKHCSGEYIQTDKMVSLIECMIENDPDELCADGGVTVLDVWREDAKRLLALRHQPLDEE